MTPLFLEKVLLAIFVGALIGLEREYSKKQLVVGLRTFSLISLFGALTSMISDALILAGFLFVAAVSLLLYFSGIKQKKGRGFTTHMSIAITYFLGAFVGLGYFTESISLSIIVSVVLFSKERLHKLVEHLTEREVGDLLEFLILLGIIYPIIPDSVTIYGITFPLMMIWMLIVLVSLINFAAFLSSRFMSAAHEVEAVGFFGGVVSSVATVISLFENLKSKTFMPVVLAGFLIANAASLFRNAFLMMVFEPTTITYLFIPCFVSVVFLLLLGVRKLEKVRVKRFKVDSPFNVSSGIKLGVYVLVLFTLLDLFKGFSGAVGLLSFFGGIISTSAVVISLVSLMSASQISPQIAAFSLALAQVGSFLSTLIVAYFYKRKEVVKSSLKELTAASILLLLLVTLSVSVL